MPWCHRCRVEYLEKRQSCPECDGPVTDRPAPERRMLVSAGGAELVVVAMLPPEEALVASGRLEAGGIPNALRDVGAPDDVAPVAVEVLVAPLLADRASAVLQGKRGPRRRRPVFGYLFLVTAIAVFLSGMIVIARWIMTGSPIPG